MVNKLPERIFDLVHFEPFLSAVHRPAQPAQQSPLAAVGELSAQCCGHVRVIAGAAEAKCKEILTFAARLTGGLVR